MDRGFKISLDRTSDRTLTDQVVSAVRSGILQGFWKEGQRLPTRKDFVGELGVSGNVIQRAMARLAAEGLVVPRPRLGCIVRRVGDHAPRRLVLEVSAGRDCSFCHTRFLQALRERLALGHVWCVSTVLPRKRTGRFDYTFLDDGLSRRPDLVIAHVGALEVDSLSRRLDRLPVPYVLTGNGPRVPSRHPNLLASREPIDFRSLFAPFVDDCRAAGIRSVLWTAWTGDDRLNPRQMLEAAGIYVETLPLGLDESCEDFDRLFATVGQAFRGRLARGPMCDLVFSADDYITTGFLPVLLEAGLRIPKDVGLVTLRNKGGGPAFPKSFACFENDPHARGVKTAESILGWFKTGTMAAFPAALTYVRGETFPVAVGRRGESS